MSKLRRDDDSHRNVYDLFSVWELIGWMFLNFLISMRTFFVIVAILLVIGLANAVYVFVEKNSGDPIACYVVDGCDRVLSSSYAYIFGIPLYVWGCAYYACALIALLSLFKRKISELHFFLYVLVGFIASLIFLYIQAFVLHAFCFSCLVSATIAILITAYSWFFYRKSCIQAS